MDVETKFTAEAKAEANNGTSKKRKAATTVKTTKRARTAAVKQESTDGEEARAEPESAEKAPVKRATRGPAAKVKVTEEAVSKEVKVEEGADGKKEVKVKKTRTRKKKEEEDLAPLEPRTVGSKLIVGAHVSAAGGNATIRLCVSLEIT